MAFVLISSGKAIEVTSLKLTGPTVSISAGVATVGAGPTYYPVALGDLTQIAGSDGIPHEVGSLKWGQGQAIIDTSSGITTLGTGSTGDSTRTIPGTLLALSGATVSDKGDGLVEASIP